LALTDGDQHAVGEPRKTVTAARISGSACEQREIGCVIVAEDAAVTAGLHARADQDVGSVLGWAENRDGRPN
jgi:pyrimidine deaminase RibD-like protein